MKHKRAAIVLAAGRGARINAKSTNKVTYKLGDKSMVEHTVDSLKAAGINQIVVVVGHLAESVKQSLGNTVDYATQAQLLGTGDAAKAGMTKIDKDVDQVIIVSGDDSAFYPPDIYKKLYKQLESEDADVILLTLNKQDPAGLGRIIRSKDGNVVKIVEDKVASDKQKKITEINTSTYCIKRKLLDEFVGLIKMNDISKEFYLTDIIEIANNHGKKVIGHMLENENLWHGVNTKEDLKKAREKYQRKT